MALKVLGLLVLIVSVVSDVVASQKTLNFIFICSKSFPEVAAAVQLAVKHVNTSPSVDFKGYALDLTIRPATVSLSKYRLIVIIRVFTQTMTASWYNRPHLSCLHACLRLSFNSCFVFKNAFSEKGSYLV